MPHQEYRFAGGTKYILNYMNTGLVLVPACHLHLTFSSDRQGGRWERGAPTPQVGVGCNEWLEDDSYMTAVLSSQILLLLLLLMMMILEVMMMRTMLGVMKRMRGCVILWNKLSLSSYPPP